MRDRLKAFEENAGKKITFTTLDFNFYTQFVDFLTYDYRHKRRKEVEYGLKLSTIGSTIKNLRVFINDRMRRKIIAAVSIQEQPTTEWRVGTPRPVHLLYKPEPIEVTVPIPDYPPMLFHYEGKLHHVAKADGPERIEQEWWIEDGLYRDYYCVEDNDGARYWLFRLGHYNSGEPKWFILGFLRDGDEV